MMSRLFANLVKWYSAYSQVTSRNADLVNFVKSSSSIPSTFSYDLHDSVCLSLRPQKVCSAFWDFRQNLDRNQGDGWEPKQTSGVMCLEMLWSHKSVFTSKKNQDLSFCITVGSQRMLILVILISGWTILLEINSHPPPIGAEHEGRHQE